MRRIRTLMSTIVVAAMIPLTLLGAMPSTGCICADGRFKLFCERCLLASMREGALPCGRCPCCHGQADAGSGSPCSRCDTHNAADSCKQLTGDSPAGSGRCCTPVINSPLAIAQAVEVPAPDGWTALLAPEASSALGRCGQNGGHEIQGASVLPSVDLVIVYHVFLI